MKSVFSVRYRTLLQNLIQARQDQNLTQVELAKSLRRPQSFVSKYERGERRIDVAELLEITEKLSLDPLELIKTLLMYPAK